MKKVRNVRWHTVLIDTLNTETSNFVLNPSLTEFNHYTISLLRPILHGRATVESKELAKHWRCKTVRLSITQ